MEHRVNIDKFCIDKEEERELYLELINRDDISIIEEKQYVTAGKFIKLYVVVKWVDENL